MPVSQILISFGYLIFWQGYKLRRKLSGLGHVSLILSLAAALANAAVARLNDARLLPFSSQYVLLTNQLLVLTTVAGLYVFRLAVEKCTIHSRRVLLTLAGAAAMAALFCGIAVYCDRRHLPLDYSFTTFQHPAGFLFQLGMGAYFGGGLFMVGRWMIEFTRGREKHFRVGMLIAAAGVFILSALALGRAVPVVIVGLGGPKIIAPAFLLGTVSAAAIPVVLAGLSYPLLVSRYFAYRAWQRQRQACRVISVVWRECKTAYPEIVLPPRSLLERIEQSIWPPAKLARCKVESHDGLSKLLEESLQPRTEAGRKAAQRLQEAVHVYEETHSDSARSIIVPDMNAESDAVGTASQERDTRILLALAEILEGIAAREQDRVLA